MIIIKRVILLFNLLTIINGLCLAQKITLIEEWEFSERKANIPSFVSNSSYGARGMGVGIINGNKVVVIPALTPITAVHIVNAKDGVEVGTLNMTGISGGTVPISDAAVTSDGKILVSNLITKGGEIFKVYQWDKLKEQSKIAISYKLPDKTGRYGDHITVTGSINDGTAKVFAASEISDGRAYKVLCFYMKEDEDNPGKYVFDQIPKITSDALVISSSPRPLRPSVAVLPNGNLLHKGKGSPLIEIEKNGQLTSKSISKNVMPNNALSPQYVYTSNGDMLIGVYNNDLKCGTIVSTKDHNWNNASIVVNTPSLGQKDNPNGTGRFIVDIVDKTTYLYILSTNNGIGKYKIIQQNSYLSE